MSVVAKNKAVWEFGDFQTPPDLSREVCRLLRSQGVEPDHVLEPTCGRGAFLEAAVEFFPEADLLGVEINPAHLHAAKDALHFSRPDARLELGNFFEVDWDQIVCGSPGAWLILGNPPWVTSAELGLLKSTNLPLKTNFQGMSGFDAMTGKSNFDISEWMLLRYLEWLKPRGGWIGVLVKTGVARKVLTYVWKTRYPIASAAIYKIDAMQHFGASVDACLFLARVNPGSISVDCQVYDRLDTETPSFTMGFHDGYLINDVEGYNATRNLAGADPNYSWRSGVKHDCSKVMELASHGAGYVNGEGEVVTLESDYVFPMLKSSDVHKEASPGRRFMIVPQRAIGEGTEKIREQAPMTWRYLKNHAAKLDGRGSSIYRNKPQFSIFGVGSYSFAPWKVAISGFYKALRFTPFGPHEGKPVVFDDTVYFLPAQSEQEARFLSDLLNGDEAQRFYRSMVFWEDKRPITADLLKRLSMRSLAACVGRLEEYEHIIQVRANPAENMPELL